MKVKKKILMKKMRHRQIVWQLKQALIIKNFRIFTVFMMLVSLIAATILLPSAADSHPAKSITLPLTIIIAIDVLGMLSIYLSIALASPYGYLRKAEAIIYDGYHKQLHEANALTARAAGLKNITLPTGDASGIAIIDRDAEINRLLQRAEYLEKDSQELEEALKLIKVILKKQEASAN